jgi:hypothetical protein
MAMALSAVSAWSGRLMSSKVGETGGVLTLQTSQVAARKQGAGQHLVVGSLGSDLHRLFVEAAGLRIVAGGFANRALASEHASAQAGARGFRQQIASSSHLLLRGCLVSLRKVVAQQQAGADFQVDVGLAAQDFQCRVSVAAAGVGIGACRGPGSIDQCLRGMQIARGVRCRDAQREHDQGRREADPTGDWRGQH